MEDEELTFIMFLLGIRLYDHLSRLWELTHLNVSRKLPCMYYYYPLFSVEETEAQNVQMTHLKLLSSAAGFWTQAACLLFRDLDSLQRRSPKLFQHSSGKEEGRKWLFPFYQQEHWLSDFKRFRVAGQGRVEARPSSLWVTLDSWALSLCSAQPGESQGPFSRLIWSSDLESHLFWILEEINAPSIFLQQWLEYGKKFLLIEAK